MSRKDYYEVLQVTRSSSAEEVKKAFRRIALECHPDRCPGDASAEARFKEVSEAYQVLSDPEKRSVYDRFGHDGLRGQGGPGYAGFEDVFSSFNDIFEDFFGFAGSGRPRRSGIRGDDLETGLTIELAEVVTGARPKVTVSRRATCESCGGSGAESPDAVETCPGCRGQGEVLHRQGFFSLRTACPRCRGKGKVISRRCQDCGGAGRVAEEKKITVTVPPGVEEGMRLRLQGEGDAGLDGGPSGDLFLHISVKGKNKLAREGRDLVAECRVSMAAAALGGTIEAPSLDGTEQVALPVRDATRRGDSGEGEGAAAAGRGQAGEPRLPDFGLRPRLPHRGAAGAPLPFRRAGARQAGGDQGEDPELDQGLNGPPAAVLRRGRCSI